MKQKHKPTKAQQWQRKRRQAKGTLVSFRNRSRKLLQSGLLTAQEMILLRPVARHIEHILSDWEKQNSRSKNKYLILTLCK